MPSLQLLLGAQDAGRSGESAERAPPHEPIVVLRSQLKCTRKDSRIR